MWQFDYLGPMLFGVTTAGLVAAGMLLLAGGLRRWAMSAGFFAACGFSFPTSAVALFLAYAAGRVALLGWPRLPPLLGDWWCLPTEEWVWYFAGLAVVLELLTSRRNRGSDCGRQPTFAATGRFTALLVLMLLAMASAKLRWSVWTAGLAVLWVSGLTVAGVICWLGLAGERPEANNAARANCMVAGVCAFAAGFALFFSGAAFAGQLAVCLAAAMLVMTWCGDGGWAGVFVLCHVGLSLQGAWYADMAFFSLAVLLMAPMTAWLGRWHGRSDSPGWCGGWVRITLCGLLAFSACAWEYHRSAEAARRRGEPADFGGYGVFFSVQREPPDAEDTGSDGRGLE